MVSFACIVLYFCYMHTFIIVHFIWLNIFTELIIINWKLLKLFAVVEKSKTFTNCFVKSAIFTIEQIKFKYNNKIERDWELEE